MKLKVFAFIFALVAQTTALQAAIMQMQYQGTVRNTIDYSGLFGFGIGSGVFDGKSFAATFVYDSSVGARDTTGSREDLYGGTAYGAASPFISGIFTVNGVSVDILVNQRFISTHTSSGIGSSAFILAEKLGVVGSPVHSFIDMTVNAAAGVVPLGHAAPYLVNPISSTGAFSFFQGRPLEAGFLYRVDGQITVSSLIVSEYVVSAVPLPASGLMLLGSLAGVAAWRRRRRAGNRTISVN